MNRGLRFRRLLALLASAGAVLGGRAADAQVSVSIAGNQAIAQIALPEGNPSVTAQVTITFDTPVNLSADELNVSAELVDPNDAALKARLPGCLLVDCVAVDPAFPLLVTVEPLAVPWLFRSGFEDTDSASGLLGFLNTYEIEIHTSNLDCSAAASGAPCLTTAYRLFKAPVGGNFLDYTDAIDKGSVRARGRDGAFSQFLIAADTRPTLTVELDKALRLEARILVATLDDLLSGDLVATLNAVQLAVLVQLDYATAIAQLDTLIATVQAHAGVDIANVWSADHGVVNDAGEILGLAQTLRYTLVRLQNGN
jgi:hypothetical protein